MNLGVGTVELHRTPHSFAKQDMSLRDFVTGEMANRHVGGELSYPYVGPLLIGLAAWGGPGGGVRGLMQVPL